MKQTDSADFVALVSLIAAVISLSLNFHQLKEIGRLNALTEAQYIKIDTMERTILMSK